MLNYEPVGVAIFGVGVLYIVDDQFVALPAFWRNEVIDGINEPILVFDKEDNIREYNTAAIRHFPALEHAAGQPLGTAFPSLAAELNDESDLVEVDCEDRTQYYTIERQPLTIEATQSGKVVILSDVTLIEKQRRKLQRQNEQFDDFAEAITHELRNTLAIASGYLDVVGTEIAEDNRSPSVDDCRHVADALGRMERVTTDLSRLARYGQTLDNTETCDLQEIVNRGWEATDIDDMFLSIETDGSVQGDDVRLAELFRNGFEFMCAMNATIVSVSLDAGEIVIWSDGDVISPDEIERALNYGEAVPLQRQGCRYRTCK
jgi:Bacteriophytochrome (light-regulated signal transduction histidine kinase)